MQLNQSQLEQTMQVKNFMAHEQGLIPILQLITLHIKVTSLIFGLIVTA